jgi:hypothetical protein
MSEKSSFFESIGKVCVGTPIVLIIIAISGIVLFPLALYGSWIDMTIYNWFLPHYLGWPRLTLGIVLVVNYLISMHRVNRQLKEEHYKSSVWMDMLGILAYQTIVLGITWCIHHWWMKG